MDLRSGRTRLTAAILAELVRELRPVLLGKALRDVVHVTPRDLLLFFERTPGAFHDADRLHVALDPRWPRLHPVARRFAPEEFERPPFAERARARLAGAVLEGFRTVPGERTARLTFRRRSGAAGRGGATGRRGAGSAREPEAELVHELVFEFHGAHANAFLLDEEARVVALLHPATPRARACPPGSPYVPPALPPREEEPLGPPPSDAALPWVDFALRTWNAPAEAEREDALRQALARRLDGAVRRARDRRDGLRERRRVAEDRESVRRLGDLLMASLHLVRRGARSVRVPDYYRDPPDEVEIPIDPRRSPAENAEQFYARWRKLERALRTLDEELAIAEADCARAAAARTELDERVGPAALAAFDRELAETGRLPARRGSPRGQRPKAPPPRLPFRTYQSADGLEIRVGRTAADNDELTFRHTRGNDHWFHVCGAPGSHVVVRAGRERSELPEQTLLDACCLALHFSRGTPRAGEVWVTQVKHVRKPRGTPAGTVSVAQGRTLRFRVEGERLRRLERSVRRDRLEHAAGEDSGA